jgi:hypothetical protein
MVRRMTELDVPPRQPDASWAGDFSFAYLRRLLSAAQTTCELRLLGDAPAPTGERPTLHVRHDIDLSLERALAMADVEAELGVAATFLVMVDSPLYDLEEATSRDVLHRLRSLGHEVGLHMDLADRAGDPALRLDDIEELLRHDRRRLEEVLGAEVRSLSFHRPPEPLVALLAGHERLGGLVNAYAAALMGCYLADSAGAWRFGDPLPAITKPPCDTIQLLIHPFWWDDRHVTPADRLEAFFQARTAGRSPAATEAFEGALASVVRRARRSGLEAPR